jgi:voltage-gated potassium channel
VLFTDFNNFEGMTKSNIKKAAIVFINLADDTQKLVYLLNLKKHFGNLKFIVTLDNTNLKDTFHSAGVSYVLSKNEIAAKMVASYIFEPDVAAYNADLLASSKTEFDLDIQEYRVTAKNPYLGKSFGQAFLQAKKELNSILIGISKQIDKKRKLFKNPPDSTIINKGDYLILITDGKSEKRISKAFGIQEGVLT